MSPSVLPRDEDLDQKEIIRLRYRTTQKDDQIHALTAMHSRKASCEIPEDISRLYQSDGKKKQTQS